MCVYGTAHQRAPVTFPYKTVKSMAVLTGWDLDSRELRGFYKQPERFGISSLEICFLPLPQCHPRALGPRMSLPVSLSFSMFIPERWCPTMPHHAPPQSCCRNNMMWPFANVCLSVFQGLPSGERRATEPGVQRTISAINAGPGTDGTFCR